MASSNTPEKTAKVSSSERFVSLTDEDVERFVEAEANKNTQRKMHSDVVLMNSFLGLPRCKNVTRFSLFVSFCFAVRYCLKCLVSFVLRHP